MARNIEVKARVSDPVSLRRRAIELADQAPVLLEQDDTFFGCSTGRLKLRRFSDGTAELIHYHRADETGPKPSDYVRVDCPEPDAMAELLERANGVLGRVKKTRLLLMAGRTRIHLDNVQDLGHYMELEVVLAPGEDGRKALAEAQTLMAGLDIRSTDLVKGAYLDLLSATQRQS